jgi:AraC-like DNA-binding protein
MLSSRKSYGARAMKIIPLQQLHATNFNIDYIFAMYQTWWKDGDSFSCIGNPRKNSACIFYMGYSSLYTMRNGYEFMAVPGDIIYMPQDSEYRLEFHLVRPETPYTMLVNFELSDESRNQFILYENPTKLSAGGNDIYFQSLFTRLCDHAETPFQAYPLIKSYMYRILAELSSYVRNADIHSTKYVSIEKGIHHLENEIVDDLSIAEIAAMCNVSINHFRHLFTEFSGMTPIKYRQSHKLIRAQNLLEAEGLTVSEISDMLGFSDISYFSRWFKKLSGISPLQYSFKTRRQTSQGGTGPDKS